MRFHPLNQRTLLLLAVVAAFVLVSLIAAAQAGACGRRGFEPTDATLDCIARHEGSPAYNHDGRTYDGRYQANRAFALAYTAAIGPEHWALWGSDRNAPTWTWAPAIQDEMARNGVRARGLNPWPPSRGRC